MISALFTLEIIPTARSSQASNKLYKATTMAVKLMAGLQVSGWKAVKLKHRDVLTSKRPDGVKSRTWGGLYGYSRGSKITPWYQPPSKIEFKGPRTEKCTYDKSPSFARKIRTFGSGWRIAWDSYFNIIPGFCMEWRYANSHGKYIRGLVILLN